VYSAEQQGGKTHKAIALLRLTIFIKYQLVNVR
jgi:hypothetical protein